MSEVFGVEAQRKEHPAIKSGRKEFGDVPGAIGAAKVDAQRLYHGAGGGQGMGATSRKKADHSKSLNRETAGVFKNRKAKRK